MNKIALGFVALVLLHAVSCFGAYPVDQNSISVSGLSSGAFFAVQMQVAFSRTIIGAGVFAGGPYYCAQGSMTTALTACMSVPLMLNVDTLVERTKQFASQNDIDGLENLKKQKLFLFSGTSDSMVNQGVMKALQAYYNKIGIPDSQVKTEFTLPAQHSMVTDNYGNQCSYLGSPFINNCNYDGAGKTLQWIYGEGLKPKTEAIKSNLIEFSQRDYGSAESGMGDKGFLYVPNGCKNTTQAGKDCKLHVVFHGCKQDYTQVGDDYVLHTGYNEWAEANNIIILYPQSKASYFNPSNPNGCFDWWGFVDSKYYSKAGRQMGTVAKMIQAIVGAALE